MENVKKIIFFGSFKLGLECLTYLLSYPTVRVIGLLTSAESARHSSALPRLAQDHRIPILKSEEEILNFSPDLGLSVHYLKIIPANTIAYFPLGIINLHPGPLPEYRGSFPFIHAICEGETNYGSAVHFINKKVDAGPILRLSKCAIDPNMTSWQLLERVRALLYNDFVAILPDILNGRTRATDQEEIIKRTGTTSRTYTRAMLEEKRKVDLSWPPQKIYNHIRAFQFLGLEPAYTIINRKKIYLSLHYDAVFPPY